MPCWVCSLFTFSIAFRLESLKARQISSKCLPSQPVSRPICWRLCYCWCLVWQQARFLPPLWNHPRLFEVHTPWNKARLSLITLQVGVCIHGGKRNTESCTPYPGDICFGRGWPPPRSELLLCVASRTESPALPAPLLPRWGMCLRISLLLYYQCFSLSWRIVVLRFL